MNSAIAGNGQKIILLVGRKFWVHSWSYFRRGFGVGWDCLVQYWIGFVSGFVRVNVLSTFKFDAVWFTNFSTEFFYRWTLWIGTIVLSLIRRIQNWKFMLKFMMVLCRIWILKRIARVRLLRRFNGGPESAVLLLWFLLKIRSVRILGTIVCSGTFPWLSPTWDADKLTLKVGFICPFGSLTLPI